MPRCSRRLLALCLATVLGGGGVAMTTDLVAVEAADAPWTLPTVPPACTSTQANSGNVAGCVIKAGAGLPESRGWPTPPFPEPTEGEVIPWVDLAIGSSGTIVAKVQQALIANSASIAADGQFGPATEAAVKAFQTARSLPSTGIVDQATADALGVQNTAAGVFPPAGWKWLGWGYNGSAALIGWEAQLVSNKVANGTLKVGQLRSFAAALPLFEGFLAEIQARGYAIRDGGSYVFRCTASTRKDCNGLTRSALSNHSYGLATDLNTSSNPMKTYYGINGATACATPMLTDMPQWVVQTAEKWGLYWGGYGWSSGCSSPTQIKSSASRDPMHFEFNGTVTQARAILAANMLASGGRCIAVVDNAGVVGQRCLGRTEIPGAGWRLPVSTQAPTGASAALVNITSTGATSNGYITAEGCGAVAGGTRAWSNTNLRPGRNVAALAVVNLDSTGRFCLYQSAATNTIVDVQGFFAPASAAPSGALFTPVAPLRVVDTRTQPFCSADGTCFPTGPVAPGTELVTTAAAPLDAVATIANLTVAAPSGAGYVTADTCASLQPGPQTRSNMNFVAADTVTNLAVVPSVGTEQGHQFCTYSPAGLQQMVDVQGYFAPAAGGGLGYNALTPTRMVDTRQCWSDPVTSLQRCNQLNDQGSVVRVRAPAGAAAVLVNLTTVQATTVGSATARACSALPTEPQGLSNVTAVPGVAVADMAIVPVDPDGTFCVRLSSPMHLVVDLAGTFSTSGALRFLPITPVRRHDSRPPA